jgi:hypothetical protein
MNNLENQKRVIIHSTNNEILNFKFMNLSFQYF